MPNDFPREWVKIFNGNDLTGWHILFQGQKPGENFKNTFRIKNGILSANLDNYKKFENKYGLLYFDSSFDYYRIRLEYRFAGPQLAGGFKDNDKRCAFMIHAQPLETISSTQVIPVGLEVELLGGVENNKKRTTANICTPGTSIENEFGYRIEKPCMKSTSGTYYGEQWVKLEIHVYGDSLIQHFINDSLVLHYSKPRVTATGKFNDIFLGDWGKKNINKPIRNGFIAILIESQPVEFKNIELLNLRSCRNPQCSNYKEHYIKELKDDCRCKQY